MPYPCLIEGVGQVLDAKHRFAGMDGLNPRTGPIGSFSYVQLLHPWRSDWRCHCFVKIN